MYVFNIYIIYPVMSSMRDIIELLDESLKMKSFSHPNVLNLIGVCVDAGPAPYVVMPYMANGSLLHYLRKERPHLTIAEEVEPELVSPVLRPSKTSRTTSAPSQSQITPSFIPSQHPLLRLRAVQLRVSLLWMSYVDYQCSDCSLTCTPPWHCNGIFSTHNCVFLAGRV